MTLERTRPGGRIMVVVAVAVGLTAPPLNPYSCSPGAMRYAS